MMMMQDGAIGPEEATLLQDEQLPGNRNPLQAMVDGSDAFWQYTHQGTLDGIPVAQSVQNLMVNSEAQVRSALVLHAVPRVWAAKVDPSTQQGQAKLKEYQAILQGAASSKVVVQQDRQDFDQSRGVYMMLVKYSQLFYDLNPRYSYLKQGQLSTNCFTKQDNI